MKNIILRKGLSHLPSLTMIKLTRLFIAGRFLNATCVFQGSFSNVGKLASLWYGGRANCTPTQKGGLVDICTP